MSLGKLFHSSLSPLVPKARQALGLLSEPHTESSQASAYFQDVIQSTGMGSDSEESLVDTDMRFSQ